MRSTTALCVTALACVPGLAGAAQPASGHGIDGAVTLVSQWGPDYLGAGDRGVSLRPGFYVRWGRLSVSSGGGWASPRRDDELRGLGLRLTNSDEYEVSLGLRVDSGRQESSSPALAGMGDIKRTLRARISAEWRFRPQWELRADWTIDAFDRGGGNLLQVKLQHDWPLSDAWSVASGATLAVGGPRYMQTYFGVTPEQAQRTGYPVFEPDLGLRDVALFSTVRVDFGHSWVGTAGVGWTRVLGDAARSPLTRKRNAWSGSAGIGWRF